MPVDLAACPTVGTRSSWDDPNLLAIGRASGASDSGHLFHQPSYTDIDSEQSAYRSILHCWVQHRLSRSAPEDNLGSALTLRAPDVGVYCHFVVEKVWSSSKL